MKKNYIVAILIIVWLLVIYWAYKLLANDDYICYIYSSSVWECKVDYTNCSDWNTWKRTCNWIITTTYTRWKSYSCWNFWAENRSTYTTNSACSVEETDTQSPDVSEWWIE